MNFRVVLVLILFSFFSCKKREAIPDSLGIAFNYLDQNWNKEEQLEFKKNTEKALTPVFYGIDIEAKLQNELLENHKASLKLSTFFDSLGIKRLIDKSGLILNTYHNHINDKNIGLKKEANSIIDYWKPIEKCDALLKSKAQNLYADFIIKDTIIIKMPVDEHNNAVNFSCPNIDWNYKEGKDLTITSVLIKKHPSSEHTKAYFELKLLNKSKKHTEVLLQEVYRNDIFKIPLYNSWKFSKPKRDDKPESINI